MSSATVRISPRAHQSLKELAKLTGEPMPAVLDRAIEDFRRRVFLEGLSQDFAELRADPKQWEEERSERRAWDAALADGLEDE